jgi:hypothetical protein
MLDGKVHEPGDPTLELSSRAEAPRLLNAVALLEGLAALEAEFETILSENAPSSRQALERRAES